MKINTRYLLVGCVGALASAPIVYQSFTSFQETLRPVSATVKLGNNLINLEVADDDAERNQGLMGRRRLSPDRGMLFLFEPPVRSPSFWMKNTHIPLDIIFLNDGRVVHITRNAQPCNPDYCPKISPVGNGVLVDQVIEVNGRVADSINTGDFLSVSPK